MEVQLLGVMVLVKNNAKNNNFVNNLTNARQITIYGSSANGGQHACAIKTDNTSVCWGENAKRQLADNTTADCGYGDSSSTPQYQKTACATPIFDDNTAQGNLKEVAAGEKFTVWLDNNGKVYSSGECSGGRLGNGCTDNNTKTATTVMTGVKDIDVQRYIACAHKNDNTLHCWGENSGNQITSAHSNDVQTPLQIATNVSQFDVGAGYVAILYDNNTTFCTDTFYQSRLCSDEFSAYTSNIKQIYGSGVVGVVLDNGTQASYGYDYQGAVGDKTGNSPQKIYAPVQGWIQEDGSQSLIDNISYVATGGNGHLLAIMDNGSVVGVGSNNSGQIGGTASNLTCYWQGSANTPCPDASSGATDVWIYLGLSPTSVSP